VLNDATAGTSVDIAATDCVLSADYDSFGWQRGVTALITPSITCSIHGDRLRCEARHQGSTAIGYYEYTDPGKTTSVPGLRDKASPPKASGTSLKGNKFELEDAWRGGKVPQLDPGREIKQLLDERPHPNSVALLEWLNRDIAAGLEMSSDVLWNIAKLGGASVRYVLADAQTTVERHQQILVDQLLTRFWVYFIAKK